MQCPATLQLQGQTGAGDVGGVSGGGVDAAGAFVACLRTDRPDGLMTTVVCDTMGIALGLVSEAPG